MVSNKGSLEYKLVIVTRDDIDISGGKLAAQVAHAAVTCAIEAKARKPKWFAAWYREGQRKVVLRAKDLEHLRDLSAKARKLGLPQALITDAGYTELPPNTTTCLGIGPAPETEVDRVTGSLPLA